MEGIPTQESLLELDLDYVSEDFIKRGILTKKEDRPSKKVLSETEKD
jgi:hypothetical protein